MSKINLTPNASGTGVFTIASPNSNTDYTMNLPEINGGTLVSTDASGNVGIGTDAPSTPLDVKSPSTTSDVIRATNNTGTQDINITQRGSSGWAIKSSLDLDLHADYNNDTSSAASNVRIFTDNSERMRIDSSGNVLVGTTSPSLGGYTHRQLISEAGAGSASAVQGLYKNTTAAGRYFTVYHNQNGVVGSVSSSATGVSYNTSSDYRLKENVVDLDNATDRLKQIPVHRFNFITDADVVVDGFLAHEVQAIVPEAITGTKDEVDDEGSPKYQGIDQSKLVPLLTAALQEAVAKIEDLESRLSAVETN